MGDSGLTTTLAVVAMAVIIAAFILAGVAWWVRRRTIRIAIGSGLVLLGLLSVVLSFVGSVLVTGMGVVIIVLGVRTRQPDGKNRGASA
jgi:hypothetical protein